MYRTHRAVSRPFARLSQPVCTDETPGARRLFGDTGLRAEGDPPEEERKNEQGKYPRPGGEAGL